MVFFFRSINKVVVQRHKTHTYTYTLRQADPDPTPLIPDTGSTSVKEDEIRDGSILRPIHVGLFVPLWG